LQLETLRVSVAVATKVAGNAALPLTLVVA